MGMELKQKPMIKKIIAFGTKIGVMAGVIVVFYKVPSMIADKISYLQLKNKNIKQELAEDDQDER